MGLQEQILSVVNETPLDDDVRDLFVNTVIGAEPELAIAALLLQALRNQCCLSERIRKMGR